MDIKVYALIFFFCTWNQIILSHMDKKTMQIINWDGKVVNMGLESLDCCPSQSCYSQEREEIQFWHTSELFWVSNTSDWTMIPCNFVTQTPSTLLDKGRHNIAENLKIAEETWLLQKYSIQICYHTRGEEHSASADLHLSNENEDGTNCKAGKWNYKQDRKFWRVMGLSEN